METVRHKFMLEESQKHLAAAELLKEAGGYFYSIYFLKLLGFELLLKLVAEQSGQAAAHNHKYECIFARMPKDKRDEIIDLAGGLIGPSGLQINLQGVLEDLGSNFIQLRYPHDKYGHLTEEEYKAAGEEWVAAGAKDEDADYRFHLEELRGLIHALQQVVEPC